jgi:hypothetical protein
MTWRFGYQNGDSIYQIQHFALVRYSPSLMLPLPSPFLFGRF